MIYDKEKLKGRTYIGVANELFNMGRKLEGETISKQNKLIAGRGITITSKNVIYATDGSGVTVDQELDAESTNPVENRAVAEKVNDMSVDINTNTEDIRSINGDIVDLQGDVVDLQGRTLSDMGLTYTDIIIPDE